MGLLKGNVLEFKCSAGMGDVPPSFKLFTYRPSFFRVVWNRDDLFTLFLYNELADCRDEKRYLADNANLKS